MADKKKQYVVVGPVAVAATSDGSERYMYRGALVSEPAFTAESIKHLVSVGLLKETDAPGEENAGDDKPSDSWNNDKILTWMGENGVDVGEAKTKAEYLAAITAAGK
jgi:hypothetical protein